MVICKLSWLYINILDSVDNDRRLYLNVLDSVDNDGRLYLNVLDSVDNDGWLYLNILVPVDNDGWLYRLWIIVACCELLLSAVIRLLNYSFFYIPSARFFTLPSSRFTKRNSNSHSSFFILHSSFKKSPSVGRVTARYFPHFFCYFHWFTSTKRQITHVFRKKYPQKFW